MSMYKIDHICEGRCANVKSSWQKCARSEAGSSRSAPDINSESTLCMCYLLVLAHHDCQRMDDGDSKAARMSFGCLAVGRMWG